MIFVCYPVVTVPDHSYSVMLDPGQATLVIPRGTPDGVYTNILKTPAGLQEVEYGVGVKPGCKVQKKAQGENAFLITVFIVMVLILALAIGLRRGPYRRTVDRTWGRDMRRKDG
jgi:hypothetical protein